MIDGKWNKKKILLIQFNSNRIFYLCPAFTDTHISYSFGAHVFSIDFLRALVSAINHLIFIHGSACRKEEAIGCREHTESISHFIPNVCSAQNFRIWNECAMCCVGDINETIYTFIPLHINKVEMQSYGWSVAVATMDRPVAIQSVSVFSFFCVSKIFAIRIALNDRSYTQVFTCLRTEIFMLCERR